MSNIGEKIRNRRTELEMTQQELAERMGYKHKSSINKIELGMTEVTIDQAELFADVLDVPVSYLMGWTEEQNDYYFNEDTAQIAQQIYEDKELRALFDAARGISPEDMKTLYSVALAMKRKERGEC